MNKTASSLINKRLLYRRQYFIGPKFVDYFSDWNNIKVGKIYITTHPDLEVSTAKNESVALALLGFAFDYKNPQFTNNQIINLILKSSKSFEDIIKATFHLAGRWIIVYSSNSEVRLLNDPGGLRQIFYSRSDDKTWCASQPHILANLLNVSKKESKEISAYLNSKGYQMNERCWIGNDTIYDFIYHLPCNHYLNLSERKITRYWPKNKTSQYEVSEVVNRSSEILIQLIEAANYRYETAQIITSGWDTRLLLAASKTVSKDQKYFVHKLPNMGNNHEDIYIPLQLSKALDINFKVIDCSDFSNDFEDILTKNVGYIQSDKKKYQHFNYYTNYENKLIISGNVSPLVKEQYHSVDKVTATNLARLIHLHNNKLALRAISNWLKEIKKYATVNNIKIDFEKYFYWEVRFGWWAPMYNAELDIATEEFSPHNCRDLIDIMNSVPTEYRIKPKVLLYKLIIQKLWPELLSFPVNPNSYQKYHNENISTIKSFQKILKKLGLYKITRFFYRKFI